MKYIKIIVPILIILIAVVIGKAIIDGTKKPEKKRPQRTAYTVKAEPFKPGRQTVKLQATGTVSPASEIQLRARVSGEIIAIAPGFIDGGTFRKGERMLTLDPVDYKLALEQKKAALAEAEFQLRLEEGQRDIAAREWELIGSENETSEADRELALRVPHLKFRQAKLEAAQAELEKAQLDLTRTEIRAPFDVIVVERKANLGTQATLQENLATLSGTAEYFVRASIPVDRLKWIRCHPQNGSAVSISGTDGSTWTGRAIRMEGELEEKGRMARIIIAVSDPLQGQRPLLLNEYVRVEVHGSAVENAYRIPRSALHEDRQVWLATPAGTLEIREVEVAWRDAADVIISNGLNEGERVVLTNLSTPINGMKLRIEGEPAPQPNRNKGKGPKSNEK